MHLFRVSSSIYGGSDIIIGANYDLLAWFVAAGVLVIVAHALYKVFAKTNDNSSH